MDPNEEGSDSDGDLSARTMDTSLEAYLRQEGIDLGIDSSFNTSSYTAEFSNSIEHSSSVEHSAADWCVENDLLDHVMEKKEGKEGKDKGEADQKDDKADKADKGDGDHNEDDDDEEEDEEEEDEDEDEEDSLNEEDSLDLNESTVEKEKESYLSSKEPSIESTTPRIYDDEARNVHDDKAYRNSDDEAPKRKSYDEAPDEYDDEAHYRPAARSPTNKYHSSAATSPTSLTPPSPPRSSYMNTRATNNSTTTAEVPGDQDLLLGLVRINEILEEKGFTMLPLTSSDIDQRTKTVSVVSVNAWSNCILECIQEMADRLQQQQRVMQSMAHNARTGGLSQDALLDKCEVLEQRLGEAKQKMANAEMQRSMLEDEKSSRSKQRKSDEGEVKRITKQFDLQMRESERRVRLRDAEIERLKLKLSALAVKERATAAKHKTVLAAWRSGAILKTSTPGAVSPTNRSSLNRSSLSGLNLNTSNTSTHSNTSTYSTYNTNSNNNSNHSSPSSTSSHRSPVKGTSPGGNTRYSGGGGLTPGTGVGGQSPRGVGVGGQSPGGNRRHSGGGGLTPNTPHTPLTPGGGSRPRVSIGEEVSALDVIEALDAQKIELERRNEELNEELAEMNRTYNYENIHRSRSRGDKGPRGVSLFDNNDGGDGHQRHVEEGSSLDSFSYINEHARTPQKLNASTSHTPQSPTNARTSHIPHATRATHSPHGTHIAQTAHTSPSPPMTQTATKMYELIGEQERKIEGLEVKCDRWRERHEEGERGSGQLRGRIQEMQEEVDNLRIDLTSRPSIKQWNEKNRETKEMEEKLHDLIVMRRESAELKGQRKHMSAKEKMLVDKRNYEMGLYVLDSLPGEVMKDALKGVCRELGLNDISEVQPALVKLKAVVGAVPRMERFITQVCNHLFTCEDDLTRSNKKGSGGRKRMKCGSMEDVLPLLKRWWDDMQVIDSLSDFRAQVRGIALPGEVSVRGTSKGGDDQDEQEEDGQERAEGGETKEIKDEIDTLRIIFALKELSSFHLTRTQSDRAYEEADDVLKGQGHELLNRTIAHVKYLFGVTSLEGLLPRMNQVYLIVEENKNFLNSARELLGVRNQGPGSTDGAVCMEIIRILTEGNPIVITDAGY